MLHIRSPYDIPSSLTETLFSFKIKPISLIACVCTPLSRAILAVVCGSTARSGHALLQHPPQGNCFCDCSVCMRVLADH